MGKKMGNGNLNNYEEKETGRKEKETAITRFVTGIILRNIS